jgi:hypothetical protein
MNLESGGHRVIALETVQVGMAVVIIVAHSEMEISGGVRLFGSFENQADDLKVARNL